MSTLQVMLVFLFILFSGAALAEPDDTRPEPEEILRAIDDYAAFKAEFFGGEDNFQTAIKDFVDKGTVPHGLSEQRMKEILATEITFCAMNACAYFERYVAKAVSLDIDFFAPNLILSHPVDAGAWGDECTISGIMYEQGVFSSEDSTMNNQHLKSAAEKLYFRLCEDELSDAGYE